MEAEHAHRPSQASQPSARKQRRSILEQRPVNRLEVRGEFLRAGVGRRIADRVAHRFVLVERAGRGGDPCVQAGQRTAVRLVTTMRALVRGALGERVQCRRGIVHERRHAELGAERVHLVEVEIERPRRLHPQRPSQDVRRHERIAVAVAADPRGDAQERRQVEPRSIRIAALQFVLEAAVQQRHLRQERLLEERQPVRHLVEHVELLESQHAGLPEREHGAADFLVVVPQFARRELTPVTCLAATARCVSRGRARSCAALRSGAR